jgi:hypothetical protein
VWSSLNAWRLWSLLCSRLQEISFGYTCVPSSYYKFLRTPMLIQMKLFWRVSEFVLFSFKNKSNSKKSVSIMAMNHMKTEVDPTSETSHRSTRNIPRTMDNIHTLRWSHKEADTDVNQRINSVHPALYIVDWFLFCRLQCLRGLRHDILRPLEHWVRISLTAWLCVYILCLCQVAVLRRADPPSKVSYRLS